MRLHLRLAATLLLIAVLVSIGATPQVQAAPVAAQSEPPAVPAQGGTPVQLPPFRENEPAKRNDDPASADRINNSTATRWVQTVQGTIGSASDVDYFRFEVRQPATSVRLRLEGLTADYDLVLASEPSDALGFDPGREGLEEITEVGGSISAIGGSISAIGGSISAIGGSISAISANSGTASEQIETLLWLPGTYYAVVANSNGQFSETTYNLEIELNGSGLAEAPPSPEVEIRGFTSQPVTTLYITNFARMNQRYPGPRPPARSPFINAIENDLSSLAFSPPNPSGFGSEFGYILDLGELVALGSTRTITDAYALWDANAANPLYANYIAGIVDNAIEAVALADETPGVSGPNPGYRLGSVGAPLLDLSSVRNVVLVGGDDILPGFRLPDLTTIANEAEYADYLRGIDASGIIDPNSPQGAALRFRMITSDNPFGADRPYRFYGFPFFLPRLAVSRLVERPDEIATFLSNYIPGETFFPDFTIDLYSEFPDNRAFVSGYDFLKDQATAIASILQPAIGSLPVTALIDDEWTSTELERDWFNGRLDTEFSDTSPNATTNETEVRLSSVNAHFDHWQVIPAQPTNGTFLAQRLLDPTYAPDAQRFDTPGGYFRSTLSYSVGCHSGFNVLDGAVLSGVNDLFRADFAQAYNKHGGNWIGNTGYGYGTADGIDYSERLALLLSQELMRDVRFDNDGVSFYVGQSIGEALRNAKTRYLRNSTSLGPYDYKVLHIMSLYGLPFIRTFAENPVAPPEEDERPDGAPPPLETQAPYTPSNAGRLTRTITFTLDLDDDDYVTIPRTNSRVLVLGDDDIGVQDEFVQRSRGSFPDSRPRLFLSSQVGTPVLPSFAYDISASSAISDSARLRVRDVIFLRGIYSSAQEFDPQITQVVTETNAPIVLTRAEPSFEAGVNRWYPDKFFGFSSVGEGEQARDQLTAAAAQFRAGPGGVTGTLRPYEQMVFQVIYDDPGQITEEAAEVRVDDEAPVIESVKIAFVPPSGGTRAAQSGQAQVLLTAYDEGQTPSGSPNSGLDPLAGDISGVYLLNGRWQPLSFRPVAGAPRSFVASLSVASGDVRVIVRVTDRAGNSSYYTAKGSFQPPVDRSLVRLPLVRR